MVYIRKFKNRKLNLKKPVEVYRNIRNPNHEGFSIRQNGKVIGHTNVFALVDCQFIVNEAGRKRVLKTKRKNVHAFIRGFWLERVNIAAIKQGADWISYNPYKYRYFYSKDTLKPIYNKGFVAGLVHPSGLLTTIIGK